MALIGEMHYLTIGNKTYSIPIPESGSNVSYTPTLTSGTQIGTLEINSDTYNLFAPTPNAGTVTSVRVQATSPVQSSTSTAQSATLNTTISLANGYGDTKNPYGTKTANYVLAGPTTGSAAAPSFRKLVAADIPDLSGTYLTSYTETDPVFVASAAHGITSTDISNWNSKSDTDEKLKTNTVSNSSTTYYPIFGSGSSTASTKYYSTNFRVQPYDGELNLQLGQASNSPTRGRLILVSNQPNAYGYLVTVATGNKTYTLPDATGTIALTSDIPSVPTNISAFTNDAGYITSADVPEGASAYTGTISAVTSGTASAGTNNGFARGDHVHNITSSTITTALGYTPYDSTNPNGYISSYTDEKLKWTASTSSNTYYPLQSTSTATTSTANTLNSVSFYQYYNTAGGYRRFILGNTTSYTSTGGAYGTIRLYGTGATYYGDLNPGTIGANSLTGNRTWTLPNATGTIALTSDIPTVPTITLNGSSTTSPSFYAPTSAGTSGYYLKSNGSGSAPSWTSFPTIPSISLNGSSTTSPSFYAPTTAGTSGYYLKSNGSGAPSWTSFPTIPSISLNGSSTTSPSFYAPTTAGTSGYYLKSNGSGAPSWTAFPNIPTISQTLTSGVEIATVTVGSNTTKLYAPQGSGSSSAVIVSEEYTFTFSFDAGTIGTRGYQGSQTITKTGYTPISVVVTYVGSSTSYFPVAFLGSYGTTLYCNAYRATSSAVSNTSIHVTIYYALDDGNAVSVNTYNGEVS